MTLEQELSGSVLDNVSLELKMMVKEFTLLFTECFQGDVNVLCVLLQFPLLAILQYF